MPNTYELEQARIKAVQVLGGTARNGRPGEAQQAANVAVTNQFVELYAQLTMYLQPGRASSLAFTKLEEAKMWAVNSIFKEDN